MADFFDFLRLFIEDRAWRGEVLQALSVLQERVGAIMATVADIKAAEDDFKGSLEALIALTDSIFAKLSAVPDPDPAVQDVLDMIAANKAAADAAVLRDTPA